MMLGLLFGAFVVLLVIGMPVAYAMAVSVVTCLIVDPALPGIVLSQKMFTSMDSFSLMAVPFFMLAGTLNGEKRNHEDPRQLGKKPGRTHDRRYW